MTSKFYAKKQSLSHLDTIHETATGLYSAGIIDGLTMRGFDSIGLPLVKDLSPQEIKKIRLREKLSQAVFAKFLNISVSTVKQWELGEKHPRGTSLKLLNIVAEKGLAVVV